MSISDKDMEELRRIQSKLKEVSNIPVEEMDKNRFLSANPSPAITPPTQRGVSTAEIAELVIKLTETLQENNKKLTEVTEAINALQDSSS